jgi:hypothetical protein
MIQFELAHAEAELLHKILDSYLGELAVEMAANGIEDFTGILKKEEQSVQKMLHHLKEQGIGILTADQVGDYE